MLKSVRRLWTIVILSPHSLLSLSSSLPKEILSLSRLFHPNHTTKPLYFPGLRDDNNIR
jgi:hypothetical protein